MINYTLEDKANIWLSIALSSALSRTKLISIYGSASEIYNRFDEIKIELLKTRRAETTNKLEEYHSISKIDEFIEKNEKSDIQIITMSSPMYPSSLKNIEDPPIVLYCKGDLSLLNSKKIAVVGPREVSRYGLDVVENLVRDFAKANIVVVSGVAKGVDAMAHRTAIRNNGKTIAVSPCGVNKVYPSEHKELYAEIIEKGLLISEYALGSTVKQFTFQERNRIVSGLSDAVLLPECKKSGGTVITAESALSQGKTLFAVPGSVFSQTSEGCNAYIRDKKAIMTLNSMDVLNVLGVEAPKISEEKVVKETKTSKEESIVLQAVKVEDRHYETLLQLTGLTPKALNILLFNLEMNGLIKKLPGNYYGV